jgi:hypothetical protein
MSDYNLFLDANSPGVPMEKRDIFLDPESGSTIMNTNGEFKTAILNSYTNGTPSQAYPFIILCVLAAIAMGFAAYRSSSDKYITNLKQLRIDTIHTWLDYRDLKHYNLKNISETIYQKIYDGDEYDKNSVATSTATAVNEILKQYGSKLRKVVDKKVLDEGMDKYGFWKFMNGPKPTRVDMTVGLAFGLIFGFIDNAGLFFGMDMLDPLMRQFTDNDLALAGFGNVFSDTFGASFGTFLGIIIQNATGFGEAPKWADMIGVFAGTLLGVLIPKAIMGKSSRARTKDMHTVKADGDRINFYDTQELAAEKQNGVREAFNHLKGAYIALLFIMIVVFIYYMYGYETLKKRSTLIYLALGAALIALCYYYFK